MRGTLAAVLLFLVGWRIIKSSVPKTKREDVLQERNNILCLFCGTRNPDITEQGLCSGCGNVIL